MTDDTSLESQVPRLDPITGLVLAAIAAVPVIFATGYSEFETVKTVLLGSISGIALALWGVAVVRGRRITVTAWKVTVAAGAFALFAAVASVWAEVPLFGAVEAVPWVSFAAVFLILLAPVGRPATFKDFALSVAAGAALAAAFGLMDLGGMSFLNVVWDPVGPTGAFDSAEFAIPFYAISLPILMVATVRFSDATRWFFAGSLLLSAFHFGLLADWFWAAVFAGVIVASTVVIVALQKFRRIVLLYPLFPMIILAAIPMLVGLAAFDGPTTKSDANQLPLVLKTLVDTPEAVTEQRVRNPEFAIGRTETIDNRNAADYIAGIAFELFRENPVVGQGSGGWWLSQTKYPRPDHPYVEKMFRHYPAFKSTHSTPLRVMVELGGIGLLLFLAWLACVAGMTLRALATREEQENWILEHWGLTTAISAGVAASFLTPGLELAASGVVFFGALAMLSRESAALNDYAGLASAATLNAGDSARADVRLFAGVVPLLIGLLILVPTTLLAVSGFYRGWGDLLMLRTRYDKADEIYAKAHDWLPADGEVLYNRALARKRLGSSTEAIELVNEAYELRPHDARVAHHIAMLHVKNRDYKKAVKAARGAIRLFPNYVEARKTLALAFDLQGRMNDAADQLVQTLELDPPDRLKAGIHQQVAQYYEGPLNRTKNAIEHYERALKLSQENETQKRVLTGRIEELKKKLKRERLKREGKPIPPELLPTPKKPGGHAPHGPGGHGPGGHGQPGVSPPPKVPGKHPKQPSPEGPIRQPGQ